MPAPHTLLIDKQASADRRRYVGAVNRVMAVGAAVHYRQARAVVMGGMTLQAERRLTDRQHVLIGGAVRRVTLHAVLVHRRVLKGKWPLKLGMTLEAELVRIGSVEIVARAAAMRVMAINAAHLRFADGMVVRQIGLSLLFAVALQALVILSAPGVDGARLALDFASAG